MDSKTITQAHALKRESYILKSLRFVFDGEVKECGECGLIGVGGSAAEHVHEGPDGAGEMSSVPLRSLGEAPDILRRLHCQIGIFRLQKHECVLDGG